MRTATHPPPFLAFPQQQHVLVERVSPLVQRTLTFFLNTFFCFAFFCFFTKKRRPRQWGNSVVGMGHSDDAVKLWSFSWTTVRTSCFLCCLFFAVSANCKARKFSKNHRFRNVCLKSKEWKRPQLGLFEVCLLFLLLTSRTMVFGRFCFCRFWECNAHVPDMSPGWNSSTTTSLASKVGTQGSHWSVTCGRFCVYKKSFWNEKPQNFWSTLRLARRRFYFLLLDVNNASLLESQALQLHKRLCASSRVRRLFFCWALPQVRKVRKEK